VSAARHDRPREILLVTDDERIVRIDIGRGLDAAQALMQLLEGGLERVTLRGLPAGLGMYVNDEFLHRGELAFNESATRLVAREGLDIFGHACIVRERGPSLVSLKASDLTELARTLGRKLDDAPSQLDEHLLARLRHAPEHERPDETPLGSRRNKPAIGRQLELEFDDSWDIPF
jgi:hypothetical protein